MRMIAPYLRLLGEYKSKIWSPADVHRRQSEMISGLRYQLLHVSFDG